MTLVWVAGLAFVWTVWALLFWGGIVLFDRQNRVNRFSAALGWSALHLVIGLVMQTSWLLGLAVLLAWLIFLVRLLALRYDLGLLHSLGVVAATVLGPYLILVGMRDVGSATLEGLVWGQIGFAAAVLGVWLWRRRSVAGAGDALPQARARLRRRRTAVLPVEEPPPAPPPATAPPVQPPSEPRPAPLAAVPPPLGPVTGEPSILK